MESPTLEPANRLGCYSYRFSGRYGSYEDFVYRIQIHCHDFCGPRTRIWPDTWRFASAPFQQWERLSRAVTWSAWAKAIIVLGPEQHLAWSGRNCSLTLEIFACDIYTRPDRC